MPKIITESEVEEAALDILKELGWTIMYGPDISEGGVNEERKYNEVVLEQAKPLCKDWAESQS